MMTPWRVYDGRRSRSNEPIEEVHDAITVEAPLYIDLNDAPFTMTMQTPGNERELARGLLHTEGMVRNLDADVLLEAVTSAETSNIDRIRIHVDEAHVESAPWSKRQLLSVASCGICGRTSMEDLEGNLSTSSPEVMVDQVQDMLAVMQTKQKHFAATGGCHAAAAFDREGMCLSLMEDIGRHNAVDKVIGALILNGHLDQAKRMVVSGRVSYEIVAKCFTAGIPELYSISAPSSLAIDFSKELGIRLYAYCRNHRFTRYA